MVIYDWFKEVNDNADLGWFPGHARISFVTNLSVGPERQDLNLFVEYTPMMVEVQMGVDLSSGNTSSRSTPE